MLATWTRTPPWPLSNPAKACTRWAGARARAVLELARVCFGRAEFGGIWRLTQVQLVRAPELLLTPEPAPAEPVADAEPDAAADLAESVEEFL